MATIKRKKKYLKKQPAGQTATSDTFEIERNPPPITGRYNPERYAVLLKIDATLKRLNIGEAFIIPAKFKHTVAKHLRGVYPADKFSMQGINDNPDSMRVYRLAYKKK